MMIPKTSDAVAAPDAQTQIAIGHGVAAEVGASLASDAGVSGVIVIADANTRGMAFDLARGMKQHLIVEVAVGEAAKSLPELGRALDTILSSELPLDRTTVVMAVGGGCVCDVAGMIAGLLMRGLRLVQVPTTLLAMVDASVGGKAALNHGGIKNSVGLFHFPRHVAIDPRLLDSLDERHFRNGLAEVVKVAATLDGELLELITSIDGRPSAEVLLELIRRSVKSKEKVVAADPREQGLRRVLNFGHTLGHALEAATPDLLHGEAVSLGMCWAGFVANQLGVGDGRWHRRLPELLAGLGLPVVVEVPPSLDRIMALMKRDKKSAAAGVTLVLSPTAGTHVFQHAEWGRVEDWLVAWNWGRAHG